MITQSAVVSASITIVLSEGEARALDALFGYGDESFIEFFYKHMGKHYLQPYEKDLRSLMASSRKSFPHEFAKINNARAALKGLPEREIAAYEEFKMPDSHFDKAPPLSPTESNSHQ